VIFPKEKGTGCMSVNAKRLRELRKKKGVKQEVVAMETGLSIKTIYRYESAKVKRPDKKTLKKLADYYGVDLSYILETNEVA